MVKRKLFGTLLILIIVGNIITSNYFLIQNINTLLNRQVENPESLRTESPDILSIQNADSEWLQVIENFQNEYFFMAEGPAIIGCEINGPNLDILVDNAIPLASSYGTNFFFIDFGGYFQPHKIEVSNPNLIEELYIQPIYLLEPVNDYLIEGLDSFTFIGGGMIKILVHPHFSYDKLFLELDGVVLKESYSYGEDAGPSIFNDINQGNYYAEFVFELQPSYEHILTVGGNGYVDLIIVTDCDYDKDLINIGDEIQEGLDPFTPDLWGWYDSGYAEGWDYDEIMCSLHIFLPQASDLVLYLYEGLLEDLTIDGGKYEDYINPTGDTNLGTLSEGHHHILYTMTGSHIKVKFFQYIQDPLAINPINIRTITEVLDSDGDLLKDDYEFSSNLNPYDPDFDDDGVFDGYDPSPFSKLEFASNEIMQLIFSVEPSSTTLLNFLIKSPIEDHSSPFKLWGDSKNVSIVPAMRIFGNNATTQDQLSQQFGKSVKTQSFLEEGIIYDPTGVGDFIPADDPDSLYMFEFLTPSEVSISLTITFEPFHPAKNNDAIIDFRFDLIWIVLESEFGTNDINILHMFEWEEDIVIQAFQKQEVDQVDYQVVQTDSRVEVKLLDALFTNPDLGTPSDYITGLEQKIIDSGTASLADLPRELVSIYNLHPSDSDETSLYVTLIKGEMLQEDILFFLFPEHATGFYTLSKSFSKWKTVIDQRVTGLESILNDLKINYIELGEGRVISSEVYSDIDYVEFETEGVNHKIVNLHVDRNLVDIDDKISEIVSIIEETDSLDGKVLFFTEKKEIKSALTEALEDFANLDFETLEDLKDRLEDCTKTIKNREKLIVQITSEMDGFINEMKGSWKLKGFLESGNFDNVLEQLNDISSISNTEDFGRFLKELDHFKNELYKFSNNYNPTKKYRILIDKFLIGDMDLQIKFGEISLNNRKIKDYLNQFQELSESILEEGTSKLKKIKQKLTGLIEDIKNQGKWIGVASNALQILGGVLTLISGISKIFVGYQKGLEETNPQLAFSKGASSALIIAQGILELASLAVDIIETIARVGGEKLSKMFTEKFIESFSKKCSWIGAAIAIAIVALEIANTIQSQLQAGYIEPSLLIMYGIKAAIEVTVIVVSVIAVSASTGYGIIVGVAIAGITILTAWLSSLWYRPDVQITDTDLILPPEAEQRGGLEEGMWLTLAVTYTNTGQCFWPLANSEVRVSGQVAFGPKNDFQFDGPWVWGPKILQGQSFTLQLTDKLNKPTNDLWYKLLLRFELWYWEIVFVIPLYTGYNVFDSVKTDTLSGNTAVVESNLSLFSAACVPFEETNVEVLKANIQSNMADYQWHDAYKSAQQLLDVATQQGLTEEITFAQNIIASLPIRTNINIHEEYFLSPNEQITRTIHKSLGSLDNPPVRTEITPPEGWTVNYLEGFHQLSEDLSITITPPDDPYLSPGPGDFTIKIFTEDGEIVYEGEFTVFVNQIQDILFEMDTTTLVIDPCEEYNGITITNLGNTEELLEYKILVNIDGDPQDPTTWSEVDWIFCESPLVRILPGETSQDITIHPIKHYTTQPGQFEFLFMVLDYYLLQGDPPEEYQYGYITGTITITEFYDVEITFQQPSFTIYDSEMAEYEVDIQNLGNTINEFQISFSDINIATGVLDKDILELDPGETDSVSLTMTPTSWGYQEFEITASSTGVTKSEVASIQIIDDDPNAPELSNLLINEMITDIEIGFDVLNENEGDDQGVSSIEIYVDDELFISYNPDPTETSFSFIFDDGWIMEYGTHQIRIEVIDNDNDVDGDASKTIHITEFERTPDEMMTIILGEIDELKQFIDDEVFFLFDWILINQLEKAEDKVQDALDAFNSGSETLPVILDKLAKANLDLLDIVNTILEEFTVISEEDGDYISTEAHEIRDHITLVMGAIVGTAPALDIATITIDIEQLADKVFDEQNLCVALAIDIHLWEAADNLDNALITMSMDCTSTSLILEDISKANIRLADITTYLLEELGCMSEEDADYISTQCHSIRDRITITMGEIIGTEAAMQIAGIETQIEQFADDIFDNHELYPALSIDMGVWLAAEALDQAIISLALDCTDGAEAMLNLAKCELEATKCIVTDLKDCGYLTEEQARAINSQIDDFITEITALCDHPEGEGTDDGSTDTNPHGGTGESDGGDSDSSGGSGSTDDPNTNVPTH
ncbi:MAG: COG1470 family protein [Candidatus Helarchaeota archaeon]